MRTGKIIMLVVGSLLILIGLGLAAGAAAVGVLNARQGDNRFLSVPEETYAVDSYALTVPEIEVDQGVTSAAELATLQVQGVATEAGRELFLGIGPRAAVDRYLLDVQHSELQRVNFSPFSAYYLESEGSETPAPPGEQEFWAVTSSGTGQQSLEWNLDRGDWTVVVMNADGSQPVAADLQMGVRSDFLQPLTWALLISSIVSLVAGIALVVIGASGLRRPRVEPGAQSAEQYGTGAPQPYGQMQDRYGPQQPPSGPRYPVRLYGELDPNLSRWMWLVKWFLAIPHYIVLFFLWIAFFVTTVVAGFAILFTGKYPHGLFDFNVGVVRWSWRVTFYATGVLGTDRYPPFTLESTDYPADFSVDYPRELSRWLVLIKWWLLVIPQALVVSAFTQGVVVVNRFYVSGGQGQEWSDGWDGVPTAVLSTQGLSLLSLLALIAVVILLFRGRYPRHLFDLLMGLNRWSYRVLGYAALMRDEYPPFRLDQGPVDRRDEVAGLGRPGPGMGPGRS